jgi:hypothetical protein
MEINKTWIAYVASLDHLGYPKTPDLLDWQVCISDKDLLAHLSSDYAKSKDLGHLFQSLVYQRIVPLHRVEDFVSDVVCMLEHLIVKGVLKKQTRGYEVKYVKTKEE